MNAQGIKVNSNLKMMPFNINSSFEEGSLERDGCWKKEKAGNIQRRSNRVKNEEAVFTCVSETESRTSSRGSRALFSRSMDQSECRILTQSITMEMHKNKQQNQHAGVPQSLSTPRHNHISLIQDQS